MEVWACLLFLQRLLIAPETSRSCSPHPGGGQKVDVLHSNLVTASLEDYFHNDEQAEIAATIAKKDILTRSSYPSSAACSQLQACCYMSTSSCFTVLSCDETYLSWTARVLVIWELRRNQQAQLIHTWRLLCTMKAMELTFFFTLILKSAILITQFVLLLIQLIRSTFGYSFFNWPASRGISWYQLTTPWTQWSILRRIQKGLWPERSRLLL